MANTQLKADFPVVKSEFQILATGGVRAGDMATSSVEQLSLEKGLRQEPLGNIRKHSAPLLRLIRGGEKNSILSDGSSSFKFVKNKENRSLKNELREISRSLLCKDYKDNPVTNMFKQLHKCGRIPCSSEVSFHYSKKDNLSWKNGISTCKSVWVCPYCSSKIANVRCQELGLILKRHLFGWSEGEVDSSKVLQTGCYMLTLTSGHRFGDSLRDLEELQKQAKYFFWHSKTIIRLLRSFNAIGKVTSHEVTCSFRNGFHPHDHIVFICDSFSYNTMIKYRDIFRVKWNECLSKVGLYGNQYSLRFQGGNLTSEYVAKMGLEVTLGQTKKGKIVDGVEHRSPFQLLHYLKDNGFETEDSKKYINLFSEYARVIKGRTQLKFSRGLKARFEIEVLTDSEAIEKTPDDDDFLLGISNQDYKKLLPYNLHCKVLNYFDCADYSNGVRILLHAGCTILEVSPCVLQL